MSTLLPCLSMVVCLPALSGLSRAHLVSFKHLHLLAPTDTLAMRRAHSVCPTSPVTYPPSRQVWNTTTCEFVRTLSGHKRGIACLQYRDRLVVSGSSDNTIRSVLYPARRTIRSVLYRARRTIRSVLYPAHRTIRSVLYPAHRTIRSVLYPASGPEDHQVGTVSGPWGHQVGTSLPEKPSGRCPTLFQLVLYGSSYQGVLSN